MSLATPWSNRPWQRVLVYGMGLSGQAAARLLLARGVAVVGFDDRPASTLALGDLASHPGLTVLAASADVALPSGLDAVVLSPGVPPGRPLLLAAHAAGLPVIAEVELAFPFLDGPLVGITGSNGKSTTTALAGALLAAEGFEVAVCGNIGLPLSACVPPPGTAPRSAAVFVVELSSFQLEAIVHLRPQVGVFLNLSPDHLDRYPSLDAYAVAKRNLFRQQESTDWAVLNGDDDVTLMTETPGRRRFFSRRHLPVDGCGFVEDHVVETGPDVPAGTVLFSRNDLGALEGVHNLENAMAAALIARAYGTSPATIARALASFTPLEHRLAAVATVDGVTWYDDSKGTNVAATAASLEGFAAGSVHLILGGRNKGADLRYLRHAAQRAAARVYLIGEAAGEFADALGDVASVEQSGTLERAVEQAATNARPGEVVLLSPACASFDQFRNYHHRGERFRELVRDLTSGTASASDAVASSAGQSNLTPQRGPA